MADEEDEARVMNVNVGLLGHIDSGKTSLARALSTHLSTASLDKHPQSTERGITLDLGFSSFLVDPPPHLAHLPYTKVQFTLVDCPGHASLIRAIIGGAHIIDIMLLVVDVTKGVQTQTAECLVIGEIAPCSEMVVVLNKTDLLPEATRPMEVEKMKKRLRATLRATKFKDSAMVAVATNPGGGEGERRAASADVHAVVEQLRTSLKEMRRSPEGPFLFAVDHCFPIRGQGTVMTGTVLCGTVTVNDTIEIPSLRASKKVKSLQMFHRPVRVASQGDRVGICVTQLDPKLLERGLAAAPGTVPTMHAAVACVERIRFFRGGIHSKAKFHVSAGHSTVMADVLFFAACQQPPADGRLAPPAAGAPDRGWPALDLDCEYEYRDELLGSEPHVASTSSAVGSGGGIANGLRECGPGAQWVLLSFETPITCPGDALIIGSRLDANIHTNSCRLAFHGHLVAPIDPSDLPRLRVFKTKRREGFVDRYVDGTTVIGRGLFKKETDISSFLGLKVTTANGEEGTIQSPFGKSGKFKVFFPRGVTQPPSADSPGANKLLLDFKRYVFDRSKRMMQ